MLPRALVAPAVTFSTIAARLSEENPVTEMSPSAAVAPPVMLSIAPPREVASKPLILSSESTAPAVILSSAPPISEAVIPLEPSELTMVPTNSLEAVPMSVELRPASSRLATEAAVIPLSTVSVAVAPVSAELPGR